LNLLGEQIPFRRNLLFSIDRYPTWWIILLITMFFDYLSTTVFVSRFGIESEANLTTRLLMANLSPYLGNFLGKLLQLISVICMVGLSRKFGNFFLLFIILVNCWAIVVNSIS
jgi:hypothetical protein